LKSLSLIDSIVEEFKGKIFSGEYKCGDILGSQNELAQSLGVSRASLREALKRLEMMGLVESKQGVGTFLKKITPSDFMNPLSSFIVIDKKSAFELLEARLYIEGSLAAMASLRATEDDLQQLEDILSSMRHLAAAHEIQEFIKKDVQFHYAIAKASNNDIMIKIAEILRDLLRQLISKIFESYPEKLPETMEQTINFHQAIFTAIRNRDPDAARMRMEEHIWDVKKKTANLQRLKPKKYGESWLEPIVK